MLECGQVIRVEMKEVLAGATGVSVSSETHQRRFND